MLLPFFVAADTLSNAWVKTTKNAADFLWGDEYQRIFF